VATPSNSDYKKTVTRARYQQVSLQDTPYYHCISRCVRRAYLCGDDPISGQNFDHRKQWLVRRIKQMAAHFAVDICAYAVMSNHYHLVLHVDSTAAAAWSDEEVIARWRALFPRNGALIQTLQNNSNTRVAQKLLQDNIRLWRDRLTDISWFMRCVNESIARRANREDKCTGRFWEGRFKSQALLDEKALVTCMAYVDLNPVRAGITDSLELSDFTSIQERLIQHARRVKHRSYRQQRLLQRRASRHLIGRQDAGQARLLPLAQLPGMAMPILPVTEHAYFELLDITCRSLQADKSESPKLSGHALLQMLGIRSDTWLKSISAFQKHYGLAAGGESALLNFQLSRVRAGVEFKHSDKWVRGVHSARLLYGT
jgi:putative transposase